MNPSFYRIPGSITAPAGFLAAGIYCDIKTLGTGKGSEKGTKPDLGLIASRVPAEVAALFTTNQIAAAPVKASLRRARAGGFCRAIVANSGNANACTGKRGLADAEAMAALTARLLKTSALEVMVCSTGRIGIPLPMTNVQRGIRQASLQLADTAEAGHHFADAILTSDTQRKEIVVEFPLGNRLCRIAGVCKGAGMIQPGLSRTGKRPAARPAPHATMLGFVTTDARINRPALTLALERAVAGSFNCITVDGDMSTNDTVIAMANGLAENPPVSLATPERFGDFQRALNHVCLQLAQMIVRDGEGTSRLVTVTVRGAVSQHDADRAARSVANSSLVKTSWCGGDPNWGRVLDALGYSGARVKEEKVDLGYSLDDKKILWAVRGGRPTRSSFEALKLIVNKPEFHLHIHLNLAQGEARIYSADLTAEYVEFNKGE